MTAPVPSRRWVEIGADAICGHVRSHRAPGDREAHILYCPECERTALTVLRAVLPLIDSLAASGIRAERQALADLRDAVEALMNESAGGKHDFLLGKRFACLTVLALIDGGGDG